MNKGKIFYLKKNEVFAEFSEEQVVELAELLHDKELKKYEIVFEPEDKDKIFFVKRGSVVVYKITADGKKVVLDSLTRGAFFGAIGKGLPDDYFIEASEDAYVCVATKDRLYEMLEKNPKFAARVVEGLFAQLLEVREKVGVLAVGNVREKLTYLLGQLSRKYGKRMTSGRQRLTRRFTHEEMADMVGASRETVTKMLKVLEKDGAVNRKGKYLEVDCEKLA